MEEALVNFQKKKIVTKIFPSPFQKNCFLSTKRSKSLLNGAIVFFFTWSNVVLDCELFH